MFSKSFLLWHIFVGFPKTFLLGISSLLSLPPPYSLPSYPSVSLVPSLCMCVHTHMYCWGRHSRETLYHWTMPQCSILFSFAGNVLHSRPLKTPCAPMLFTLTASSVGGLAFYNRTSVISVSHCSPRKTGALTLRGCRLMKQCCLTSCTH